MPNTSLIKLNLPKDVMKVISGADSAASDICQNPHRASNFEKMFVSLGCARLCSTHGNSSSMPQIFSSGSVGITQIQTQSFDFWTNTMPAHHSDGVSILERTSICSSSPPVLLLVLCSFLAILAGLESLLACFPFPLFHFLQGEGKQTLCSVICGIFI